MSPEQEGYFAMGMLILPFVIILLVYLLTSQ